MSIPNLHVWMDTDGRHVWSAHRCADGNNVLPSFLCLTCGTHEFGHLDHAWPHWREEWRVNNNQNLGDR
jgi:hypothetical protein